MNAFLPWPWPATLAGSAAIVLTLLAMPWLRRFLGAQSAFPAWIFTLGLLVWPWELRSPASVLPPASDLPPIVVQVVIPYHSSSASPVAPPAAAPQRPFSWLLTAWASGAAILLALASTRVLRTRRLVSRSRDITAELQPTLASIGGLPRRARVYESHEIGSPAMCGIFCPVILLPCDWTSERDLHWILLHEIGHIRRGDLLWRWAFEIVRAIHWFNPLVWLAERAARIDQEMACDEWVLARGEESGRSDYGEAILRAARRRPGHWLMQAGMAESRSGLTHRIRHLAIAHPRGIWMVIVTFLVGAGALALLSPPPSAMAADLKAEPNAVSEPPSAPPVPEPTAITNSTTPAANSSTPASNAKSGPPTQVEIESIFVEVTPEAAEEIFGADSGGQQTILSPEKAGELLVKLGQQKGTQLVSAPKVTARSGRTAIVRVAREFPYPTEFSPPETRNNESGQTYRIPATPTAFEVRDVGISLDVKPEITKDNRIICELTPSAVEFLGFVNYGDGGPKKANEFEDALDAALRPSPNTEDAINQPIFRKRAVNTTVILRSGQTVVLGGLSREDEQTTEAASGFPAGFPPQRGVEKVRRTLFVFVSTRLLNAKGIYLNAEEAAHAPSAPPPVPLPDRSSSPPPVAKPEVAPATPETSSVVTRADLPFGTPVTGKPGFITSPWAPDAGQVDVRGFPAGTEVKCPYTGKMFLVP